MRAQRLQGIYEKIHARDYKLTPQRRMILEAFVESPGRHLSAEDVYNIVKAKFPEIGLATVYRTLDLLADLEILQRINFGDGRSRYEFNDEDSHHHHHLICMKCGKVQEFKDDLLDSVEELVSRKLDFEIVDHQLKFFGYCSDCKKAGDLPARGKKKRQGTA